MDRRGRYLLLAGLMCDPPEIGEAPWSDPAFWREMIALADLNGITTALPGALLRAGLWETIPKDLRDHLDALHYLNTCRSTAQKEEALYIHDVLTGVGIPCVFLKGTAYLLSGVFADDPGRRMTTDIDVLVPHENITEAESALTAVGYTPHEDTWPDLERRHHIPALIPAPGQGQFSVELHIRAVKSSWDSILPSRDVFERAQLTPVEGRVVRLPSSRDMFMHALIHAAIADSYHFRRMALRDTDDINRLWSRVNSGQTNLLFLLDETKQNRLSNYLDACLRLHRKEGTKPDKGARFSYYRQVIFWSRFKRNVPLEDQILANWRQLVRHPWKFLKTKPRKLIDPKFYRRLQTRLGHKRK